MTLVAGHGEEGWDDGGAAAKLAPARACLARNQVGVTSGIIRRNVWPGRRTKTTQLQLHCAKVRESTEVADMSAIIKIMMLSVAQ